MGEGRSTTDLKTTFLTELSVGLTRLSTGKESANSVPDSPALV